MTDLNSLTVAQLHKVIAIKERIETLQSELDSIVGGGGASSPAPVAETRGRPRKRHMSAEARAAIGAAQKRRWAKVHAGQTEAPVKRKRRVSAATRARLGALVRARWAKAKASGKSKL